MMDEAVVETVCVRGAGYIRMDACANAGTSTMARKLGEASTVLLANPERPRTSLARIKTVSNVALGST